MNTENNPRPTESFGGSEEDVPVIDWSSTYCMVTQSLRAATDFLRTRKGREEAIAAAQRMTWCEWRTSAHLWGSKGNTARPQVIETWLELLCALADSGLSTRQLADQFDKNCTGCMIYSILNAVGAYTSEATIKSAVDLFRLLLADEQGALITIDYIKSLSQRVYACVRPRNTGDYYRSNCLELSVLKQKALEDIIDGLAMLSNSATFRSAMVADPEGTAREVKQMMASNDFNCHTVPKKWPREGS